MYTILIDVLCLDGNETLLPSEGANIELVIEGVVALILLDLFGKVVIEDVRVGCFLAAPDQPPLYSLQMHATGNAEFIDASDEALETRLEAATGCALAELFRTVVINTVHIGSRERASAQASAA